MVGWSRGIAVGPWGSRKTIALVYMNCDNHSETYAGSVAQTGEFREPTAAPDAYARSLLLPHILEATAPPGMSWKQWWQEQINGSQKGGGRQAEEMD